MEPEDDLPDPPCAVCGLPIQDQPETCQSCNEPFHMDRCGGWAYLSRLLCENCQPQKIDYSEE